ncbi:glutamine amidotransferase-like class 1 domain-containing protein 3, mitochondrial [Argopecten irradians]|uniref:glutamine amidotransferase-like class 1 domain-containing protein 3, mitochondrial n=1 Tax=Argopecten irradians TaxID=31199 RepID=UPI0037175430
MARTLSSIRKAFISKHTSIVSSVLKCHFHSSGVMSSKVAVILSGCGVYDGTEVHEASATLVHLSRGGAEVSMFAPNVEQMHVVNHTKGEPMEPNRNVLVESARIARGKIDALSNLDSSKFDAIIFPGGFGAAKNFLKNRKRVGTDDCLFNAVFFDMVKRQTDSTCFRREKMEGNIRESVRGAVIRCTAYCRNILPSFEPSV